jgi:hypothetical protein
MKNLSLVLTNLTLSISMCAAGAQAQPQNEGPGADQWPPQRMDNTNKMSEDGDMAQDIKRHMDAESRMNRDGAAGEAGMNGGNPGAAGARRFGGGNGAQGNGSADFAERRQRMMKKFDANGDGVLDDKEKAKMRAFMRQRREQREQMQGNHPNGGGFQNEARERPNQSELQ